MDGKHCTVRPVVIFSQSLLAHCEGGLVLGLLQLLLLFAQPRVLGAEAVCASTVHRWWSRNHLG